MTEHLSLEHLTPFAARYHLARHVRARRRAENERLLDLIEAEANAMAARKVELQQNFHELCELIKKQSERFSITPELEESLDGLIKSLSTHSCRDCAAKPKCRHGEETYLFVKDGGNCIAPLKDLFKVLCDWVDGLWQDLPRSADLHSLPVVFATTGRSFNHDQPIIQKFHVSGYARSLRDAKGYYTKVGLEVRERSFGWRQYSLLPYLLLHEILCHAFQSLDNPPIRPDADPSDAWSEGWMDTLAYKLALEWLNKHDKTAFMRPGEYRDAERQIIDLHNARYSDEPCPAGILKPADGRKAFYAVLDSYSEQIQQLRPTRHPLTRFSLRLNAMTMPMERRVGSLVKLHHLADNDPAALHKMIGEFNAAVDDGAAIERLEGAAP